MSEWKETEIGLIPQEWKVTNIDSIKANKKASIAIGPFGSNITKDNFVTYGIPVIRGNNLNDFIFYDNDFVYLTEEKADSLSSSNCFAEDIVITHRGTLGQVGFITKNFKYDKYVISQSGMKLTIDKNKADPKFIFLFLKSKIGQHFLLRNTSQTGVPAISQPTTSLRNIPVFLPSLSEQTQIVNVIWNIQLKIDNLKKQNETLEAIAQTLFKHWFIDFEFPNEDGKPYKSSGGEVRSTELGEIPKDWRVGKLGDVATNHSETHKFQNKHEIIFINTGDVLEGNFLHKNYSSVDILPGQAKKKIHKDDILYSEIRPINKRFAYVNFEENIDDYVVSTKFMVVRSSNLILPRLLYLILKRKETIDYFQQTAESRSGTFPQITFDSVSQFSFPLPNINLQNKIMTTINPLLQKQEFNIQQIQTLTKTRDELLPKLMSGQIRVKE